MREEVAGNGSRGRRKAAFPFLAQSWSALVAKMVRLEDGPSPLLKFPAFPIIMCRFSAGLVSLLSDLLPPWFWDDSSRRTKGSEGI